MQNYHLKKIFVYKWLLFWSCLLFCFGLWGCGNKATVETDLKEAEEPLEEQEAMIEETPKLLLFVDVCGAVKEPGVYSLSDGARVYEAIEAAGGYLPGAAESYHNRARLLVDGEQIYVPSEEELLLISEGEAVSFSNSVSAETAEAEDGLVHINTATKEELMTLPGIGETKANHILTYRDANGAFSSIEDLMQVEGIKEGTYQKIKDLISL